jgi:small subunit ribosomal protein S16
MIKIRLSRAGRKNLAFYHILATNSTSPRDSKFLEKLGTYNPLLSDADEKRIVINKERAEYWLSVGAKPTEKVAKFLISLGVKGAEKHKPGFAPKAKGSNLKKKAADKLAKEKEAAAEAAKAAEGAAA